MTTLIAFMLGNLLGALLGLAALAKVAALF